MAGRRAIGVGAAHQVVSPTEVDAGGTGDAVGFLGDVEGEITGSRWEWGFADRVRRTRESDGAARAGHVRTGELVHPTNARTSESWVCRVTRLLSFCETARGITP